MSHLAVCDVNCWRNSILRYNEIECFRCFFHLWIKIFSILQILFAIVWAVPCNNIKECLDGSDEIGCKFSSWLVPCFLCGAGAVLFVTLFVFLYKFSKGDWKELMQDRTWRLAVKSSISDETKKLYLIAMFTKKKVCWKVATFCRKKLRVIGMKGEQYAA